MAKEKILRRPDLKRRSFSLVNRTKEEEDDVDIYNLRNLIKPTGIIGSIAHVVKGALGAGILSVHSAYKISGLFLGLPLHFLIGIYMMWCLFILVRTGHIISRRTSVGVLSYPDIGEAAFKNATFPGLRKYASYFRYFMDMVIMIDLFGSCCCYQIIFSKTVKQLIEDNTLDKVAPTVEGYPDLRIYLAIMMIPFVMICLLRYLKYLAPFSIAGNIIVILIVLMTVAYAFINNVGQALWDGCKKYNTDVWSMLQFVGMVNFSVSCSGIIVDVTTNMDKPEKYPTVVFIGMMINILATCSAGFFGYSAFKEKAAAPISNNFPMTTFNKMIRFLIGVMIYVTHGLNFYSPFSLAWRYIRPQLKEENEVKFEYLYRALFSIGITLIAIVFPSINALMGFLGTFCLSNMAFMWPLTIELIVIWERPGLGAYKWKLWRNLFLILIGLVLWTAGTIVNFNALAKVSMKPD